MTEPDKKKQRRRDILKAAAGVPAVFTLPTGAALAATSLTCVAKGIKNLPTPGGVTTSSDTWIRFRVPAISFNKTASGTVTSVNGFRLSKSGGGYNYFEVSGTPISQVTPASPPNISTVTGVTNYFLLVDSADYSDTATTTNYIYLGTTGTIAQPIAGASCWNSVIASPGVIKGLTNNLIN